MNNHLSCLPCSNTANQKWKKKFFKSKEAKKLCFGQKHHGQQSQNWLHCNTLYCYTFHNSVKDRKKNKTTMLFNNSWHKNLCWIKHVEQKQKEKTWIENHTCSEDLKPTLNTMHFHIVRPFGATVTQVVANEVDTENTTADDDQHRNGH